MGGSQESFQAATIEGQYGSLDIDSSGSGRTRLITLLEAVQSLATGPRSVPLTELNIRHNRYYGTVRTIQMRDYGVYGPVLMVLHHSLSTIWHGDIPMMSRCWIRRDPLDQLMLWFCVSDGVMDSTLSVDPNAYTHLSPLVKHGMSWYRFWLSG